MAMIILVWLALVTAAAIFNPIVALIAALPMAAGFYLAYIIGHTDGRDFRDDIDFN